MKTFFSVKTLLLIVIFYTHQSCHCLRKNDPVEVWNDAISDGTTQIKVITNLHGNALMDFCRDTLKRCMLTPDSLTSTSWKYHSLPVSGGPVGRVTVEFQDSIIMMQIEKGVGVYAPDWAVFPYDPNELDHDVWVRAKGFAWRLQLRYPVKYNAFVRQQ